MKGELTIEKVGNDQSMKGRIVPVKEADNKPSIWEQLGVDKLC